MFNYKQVFKKILLAIAVIAMVYLAIQSPWQLLLEGSQLRMSVNLKVDHDDVVQLFYLPEGNQDFDAISSVTQGVKGMEQLQTVNFIIPLSKISKFRIDTSSVVGSGEIQSIKLRIFKKSHVWNAKNILSNFETSGNISGMKIKNDILYYDITGTDPYFVSKDIGSVCKSLELDKSTYVYIYICLILFILCLVYIILYFYKRVWAFVKDAVQSKQLIYELAKKDLKTRYLGSYLGIIWAFIQPIMNIFVFWIVFQVGFKSAPVKNFPFILWLICGMIPWLFFAECIQGATGSVIDNSYLVKKVVFRVSILPIIRILSSLFIHVFFILIIIVMFLIYGITPSIYNLQAIYYLLASIMLILGITWITSSLIIFLRDLGQIIVIFIQFGFWLTPIFWPFEIMPEKYQFLFKLNPMYYIVEGYRDSFINHIWFWQHYNLTVNFWLITCSVFIVGVLLFKRLRPHFADVL